MRHDDMAAELFAVDPSDTRLGDVGSEPSVWVDGASLTVAVRRPGDAPLLIGTVQAPLRAAGDGVWALRMDITGIASAGIASACIEYGVLDPANPRRLEMHVWRGPRGARGAPRTRVAFFDAEVIADTPLARRHRVRAWAPDAPRALLVCADGEGLVSWAELVAAAEEPVALVGVESAGLTHVLGDDHSAYEASADPRARAYLRDVDPRYFDAHLEYVLDAVIPWADERFGRLPRMLFGVSNGAAWAAQAAALHPRSFSGVLAFSLGVPPPTKLDPSAPAHALVAGRLEPGSDKATTRYARRLRARGIPVRVRRPVRGHDHSMWVDELIPALRWVRDTQRTPADFPPA